MKQLIVALALTLSLACASFSPANLNSIVRPTVTEDGGICTAWAVGAREWLTASHCTNHGAMTIDGAEAKVVRKDEGADLALLSGPEAKRWLKIGPQPKWGDQVTVLGYSHEFTGKALVRFEVRIIGTDEPFYAEGTHDLVWAGANGLPGLSGGPVLKDGKAVSAVTGGGLPQTHAQLIGAGVTWEHLRAFLARVPRLDSSRWR